MKRLQGQVEVRFGRSLTRIVSGPDAVVVTFTDGTTESFDLLIGADGVHSRTRALVFGPEEQFSRYPGLHDCQLSAPRPLRHRSHLADVCRAGTPDGSLLHAIRQGEILSFFMYQTAKREHLSREQRLPRLRQVFAGMGWITPQLLSDVPAPESVFMDAVIQIQMPTWHQGRVALVGDACGCPTLISGQGASLAMGEAYLLAEALHETTSIKRRFASTNSRCDRMSRHSKRAPAASPRPFCLGVLSASTCNR